MTLNPADADFADRLLQAGLGDALAEAEPRHLEEPRGRYRGQSGLLARPRSVDEVALIIRTCAAAQVGVIPYGGGTGLVGGQVAPEGPAPMILSLERMGQVRATFPP